MSVETHVHLVTDYNGDPVRAYRSIDEANDAVDSSEHLESVVLDVPLMESDGE